MKESHPPETGFPGTGSPSTRVLIAVLTFRRAEHLSELLSALDEQSRTLDPAADVVIIDNDPAGSARSAVEAHESDRIRYVLEGAGGIAEGRNRALREAASHDAVVFLDDDEIPARQWLVQLVETYRRTGATAVAGPQRRRYEIEPDPAVLAARVFDRESHPTGSERPAAATNNLLLDVRSVQQWHLRFDTGYSRSGGSDTMFTRRLREHGGSIIWCDEAVAVEWVPKERLTMKWVWLRSMRSGITWARTTTAIAPNPRGRALARVRLLLAGSVRFLLGSARAGLGYATRNARHRGLGLRTQARGAGMVSGAFGHIYNEYETAQQH